MAPRKLSLTDDLERLVSPRVASGRYANASDVVRAAIGALFREEREYGSKLACLRSALEEGEASGNAEDYSLDGLIARLDGER